MWRRRGAGTAAERRAAAGGGSPRPTEPGTGGPRWRGDRASGRAAAPEQRRAGASGPPLRGPGAEGGSRCAGGRCAAAFLLMFRRRPAWAEHGTGDPTTGAGQRDHGRRPWISLIRPLEWSPAVRTRSPADSRCGEADSFPRRERKGRRLTAFGRRLEKNTARDGLGLQAVFISVRPRRGRTPERLIFLLLAW